MIKSICRSCNDDNLKEVISLGKSPLANNLVDDVKDFDEKNDLYDLSLSFCEKCYNCQLTEVVNPDKMFKNYYYVSSTTKSFRSHFESASKKYIDRFNLIPFESLVVDIGSNDGIALIPFKVRGYDVLGIDPAENICKLAEENGVKTICGYFNEDIAEEYESKADLVLASNVFAHSDDLQSMTKNVFKILKTGGTFIIEVQHLLRTIEDGTFDNIYHEHVNYWSLISLKNFFSNLGYNVFDVEEIGTHGGSIRVYINKWKVQNDNVKKLVQKEIDFGLDKIDTYYKFFDLINERKRNLLDVLSKLKSDNRKVIGYGAPAKATTLLNFFNINNSMIEYVIDDNKLKQGKIIPNVNVKIISKEEGYSMKPEYVVIFAWNFYKEIINNNMELLDKGVTFIVPTQKIKMIDKENYNERS